MAAVPGVLRTPGFCSPSAVLSTASFPPSASPSSVSYSCVPGLTLNLSQVSNLGSASRSSLFNVEHSLSMASSFNNRTTGLSAQVSVTGDEVQPAELHPKALSPLTITYLEGNSWLWEVLGLKILIDPVLVGNLDFGIPMLYEGVKKVYRNFKLEDLPELDYLLITQGYDDHCHEKTIGPLSRLKPNLSVIATPNAEAILSKYFKNVTYLEPTGESITLKASNGVDIVVRASPGPLLGPPWQRPENGYFIEAKEPKFTIYFEPHCVFEKANLEKERADVFVTPVIKQILPAYTLVSGQEDAVKVAQWLQPKFVVTMKNGDLDTNGILSKLVRTVGTNESFQKLLAQKLPTVQILNPAAGVPLEIPVTR